MIDDMNPVYCRKCRKQIGASHDYCIYCGADQRVRSNDTVASDTGPYAKADIPIQRVVPDSFAVCDYRFLPCPKCGKPVRRPRGGNPPRTACESCGCSFTVDCRGGVPVVCPNCTSTDVRGGGIPLWLVMFGMAGALLADMQPTKYVCNTCGCHFMGSPGADVGFGFFISG